MKLLVLVLLCWAGCGLSQTFEAQGRATIDGNNLELARQAAIDDALQQALFQREAVLKTEQQVNNGTLSSSMTKVAASARARHTQVLREEVTGSEIRVWIRAELVAETGRCPQANNSYRKTLAVLNFPFNTGIAPEYAPVDNAQRLLAADLSQRLANDAQTLVLPATHIRLYADTQNAPSFMAASGRLTSAIQTAAQLDSQLVLAGVIHNLAMRNPAQATRGGWFNRSRDWIGVGDPNRYLRDFELELFLYDGFSGRLIFQQTYKDQADWPFAPSEQPSFGSGAFWASDYGQMVQQRLQQATAEISEQLACQAFMARITKVEDRTLYIGQGSLTGIKVGDRFRVHQLRSMLDREQRPSRLLQDTKRIAVVRQVQPDMSQLELTAGTGQLNVQIDDILISW